LSVWRENLTLSTLLMIYLGRSSLTNRDVFLIKFYLMLLVGSITPSGENEGRPMYELDIEGVHVEYVYKEEIINYLKEGTFEYDEDYE